MHAPMTLHDSELTWRDPHGSQRLLRMHRYQTYSGNDYRGNECMRQAFEPLYYQYGVDVQFNGTPMDRAWNQPPCLLFHCTQDA